MAGPVSEHPDRKDRADVAQWLMRNTEWLSDHSEVLRNSPAWREAVEQLSRYSSRVGGFRLGSAADPWEERLARRIESVMPAPSFWHDKVLAKVRNLPVPSLPKVELPNIHLPKPSFPSLDRPPVALPSAPGTGTGVGLVSVLAAGLLAGILWRIYRLYRKNHSRPDSLMGDSDFRKWTLRRWREVPLGNRHDLIQAFEQLSILKLGLEARNWNHLVIAAGLGDGQRERSRLASHLADLYERARYAPSEEPFPDEALRIAQHEFTILAGAETA
jgi:hypothetical protein